ncbi:MAG: hypothetical protein RSC96_09470, partial [Oscillospiraceae bacterium]
MLESKGFEKNITEYVFRIMYDADDKTEAIQSVLELLAKHYNLSRVSVFEKSEDNKYVKCTFEWATDGLATQSGNVQMLTLDDGCKYQDNFDKDAFKLEFDNMVSFIERNFKNGCKKTMNAKSTPRV